MLRIEFQGKGQINILKDHRCCEQERNRFKKLEIFNENKSTADAYKVNIKFAMKKDHQCHLFYIGVSR